MRGAPFAKSICDTELFTGRGGHEMIGSSSIQAENGRTSSGLGANSERFVFQKFPATNLFVSIEGIVNSPEKRLGRFSRAALRPSLRTGNADFLPPEIELQRSEAR